MNDAPLVTLVTPSLNQAPFIAQTIESVLVQDYPHLEYLIMDGGSTDGTHEIIRRYEHDARLRWISEPDHGLSHALNKGFARSRGEIMGWLNSDDTLIGQPIAATVACFAAHPATVLVYGKAIFTASDGSPLKLAPLGAPFDFVKTLSDLVSIPQQGTFWRRSLWEQIGGLREDLGFVMDIEYWLRASRRGEFVFLPDVRATYRQHAAAKTVAQGSAAWQERTKLAGEILAYPETYPEAASQRRLIGSNLAWGLAQAQAQEGDKQLARQSLKRAIRLSPPRRRLLLMILFYVDLLR